MHKAAHIGQVLGEGSAIGRAAAKNPYGNRVTVFLGHIVFAQVVEHLHEVRTLLRQGDSAHPVDQLVQARGAGAQGENLRQHCQALLGGSG